MRIDRNINKYFDRMGPDDVSLLWGGMLEFRHRIVSMEHIMSGGMEDQPEDKQKDAVMKGIREAYGLGADKE